MRGADFKTYMASTAPTATTSGTDGVVCNIVGSATKRVIVHKITLCGVIATTAEQIRFGLYKRTLTIASSGTAAAITPFALDTLNKAAATATANFYSAVGTKGTGGGLVEVQGTLFGLAASATIGTNTVEFISPALLDPNLDPWILRGVAESLEVATLIGVVNAPTISVAILFSEDLHGM